MGAVMEQITAKILEIDRDCIVVDVRQYPEFAAGAIPSARLVPLNSLEKAAKDWDRGHRYVRVCKSGKRSEQAAAILERMGFTWVAMLQGGTEAWIEAGLPVAKASRRVWSLERQVRAIAGAMILAFTLLGIAVSSWFLGATLFVGAGLLVAGVTDICLMATVLGKLSWNRQPSAVSVR
jgi:rhodanese-related sulfurtransferase